MIKAEQTVTLRLMTYNIGGGRYELKADKDALLRVIKAAAPDILAIQELARLQDYDGHWHTELPSIVQAVGSQASVFVNPTISAKEHLHPQKQAMVDALFDDYKDWQQCNVVVSKHPFHRLGKVIEMGEPDVLPLFRPTMYLGNRNTDPRSAILARIGYPPIFPLIVALHLTTLVGERGQEIISGRPGQAAQMRYEQVQTLLQFLQVHVLDQKQVIFLMGDFNTTVEEPALKDLLINQSGFINLSPVFGESASYPKTGMNIDHIFMYPGDRLVEYTCQVIETPDAIRASDHRPVVAEVKITIK